MESIGEQLKAARLEQGFSIEDIVERTVISRHYVEALEQDNHAAFPADFYAASFLRQYSDTLGLASEDLVKALRRKLEDAEEFPSEFSSRPVRTGSHGLWVAAADKIRRWVRGFMVDRSNAVVAGVLMFVGIIGWWYVGQRDIAAGIGPKDTERVERASIAEPNMEMEAPAAREPTRTVTPTTTTPVPATVPAQSSSIDGLPNDPTPPTPAGTLAVELRASGEVWVRTVVDGGSAREAILQFGNRRALRAQQRVQFTVGNAGAVTLVINGQVQDSLGALGQVRHVEVGRTGWKAVPPGTF